MARYFRGTLAVEGAGALLSLPVFVPRYGLKGIWISVFHSVSSFCNAGIDILGPDSLAPYVGDLWLNLVTMALIILGGLGFIVWWDVLRVWGQRRTGDIPRGQCFRRLTLHSKITIVTTVVLILGAGCCLLCWSGAIRPHWAGFLVAAIDCVAVSICHLPHGGLLNGAPERTHRAVCAGQRGAHVCGRQFSRHGGRCQDLYCGVAGAVCRLRGAGREHVTAFRRSIPDKLVRRASAVVGISLLTLIGCTLLLGVLTGGSLSDVLFETASALGTVGLTRGFRPGPARRASCC